MMTKYINKIICGCLVGFGLVTASSCSDWDDHYGESTGSTNGSSLSLWQELKANSNLSDFCEVLENTKVFRMHKKTPVSYADLLDGGQAFTVVAPVNGSFNKDSLLRLVETNQGDSIVEKFFVKNHLARSVVSASSESQRKLMLNLKYLELTATTANGVELKSKNTIAKNGVIHSIAKPLPYSYNIYELLLEDPDFNSIGNELRRYMIEEFIPSLSVSNGIVDGVPVYVDSVTSEWNKFLYTIGEIDSEDSVYWMALPSDDVWKETWKDVEQYYIYSDKVAKSDSVHNYWTLRAMLDDAVFNMTDQKNVNEYLLSVPYLSASKTQSSYRPVYHKFLKPFEPGGILYGSEKIQCCNGIVYKTPTWMFDYEKTFFHPIWTETMSNDDLLSAKECIFRNETAPDSIKERISEGNYLYVKGNNSLSKWELQFRLSNTLSATYDICVVVLPWTEMTEKKPNSIAATLSYFNEKGDSVSVDLNNGNAFYSDTSRIDTIVLAENFKFPACNYFPNELNDRVSLTLKRKVTRSTASKYSQDAFIDCIFLRPKKQ